MEKTIAQVRTHRKNIDRYQDLLKTKLNKTERLFLEKRVCQEKLAMLHLMATRLESTGGQ
jgi:hypothetical protein